MKKNTLKNYKKSLLIGLICLFGCLFLSVNACSGIDSDSENPCGGHAIEIEIEKNDVTTVGTLAEIEEFLKGTHKIRVDLREEPEGQLKETYLTFTLHSFAEKGLWHSHGSRPSADVMCQESDQIEQMAFLTLKTEDGSFDEEFEAKIILTYPKSNSSKLDSSNDHPAYIIYSAKELSKTSVINGSYDSSFAFEPYEFDEDPWPGFNYEETDITRALFFLVKFYAPYEDQYNYSFEQNLFDLGISVTFTPFKTEEEEEEEEEEPCEDEYNCTDKDYGEPRIFKHTFQIIEFDNQTAEYEKIQ